MIRRGILISTALFAACGGSGEPVGQDSVMTDHGAMVGGNQQHDSAMATRNGVHLGQDEQRSLGVTFTTVNREHLIRTVRTVGLVMAPEPAVAEVTPKVAGFVDTVLVDYTGATVQQGQPLLTIYSPELVAAQQELLTAARLAGSLAEADGEAITSARELLSSARRRLLFWDIGEEQIDAIVSAGEATKALSLVSPISGVVLELGVTVGQRVVPGTRMYRIADLTEVWIEGDVFEQDLEFARVGAEAHIEVAAYPGDHIMGRVSFVHPTMDASSRTARIRVSVSNEDLRLKPGMFATLFFDVSLGENSLTIPEESLIATGERNLVFVRNEDGVLQPRHVVVGHRAGGRVVVLDGLAEGEQIVASGNFLVDAESRLGGSGGMPGMQHGSAPTPSSSSGPDHGGHR